MKKIGRPIKNGVSYFPLDVVMDDKIELIEAEHGITGFGIVIKLYQKIYADNYYLVWDKKALLVFSNRLNVDKNSIIAVINSCLEWGVFNKKLYDAFSVLTSEGIQKRFFEIVKRRTQVEVCEDLLLIKLEVSAYNNLVYVDNNGQRKGKERKGNKNTNVFLEYLLLKTSESNLFEIQDKVVEFFKYRQQKPKAKQYISEKGIDGLVRDLLNCKSTGYDLGLCLDITMERGWQTPSVDYFKPEMFKSVQSSTKNPKTIEERKQEELKTFGRLVTDWDEIEKQSKRKAS